MVVNQILSFDLIVALFMYEVVWLWPDVPNTHCPIHAYTNNVLPWDKNKKNSVESHFSGEAVSKAVFDAFDTVEKDDVGKLCLDARLKKGLTQEQASKILKVKVSIIKDFEDGNDFGLHLFYPMH